MLKGGKNLQNQNMNSTCGESPDPGVIEYYVVSTSPHVRRSWSQIYSLYSDEYDDRKDGEDGHDDEDGHDGEDEVSDLFPLLRDTFCWNEWLPTLEKP